ncbi:hypothetical protein HDV00_000138 [Rhizophlyctis rosea]|nr:hypothetical protein HDV00_000138 [Rhizophlyctis rosea]
MSSQVVQGAGKKLINDPSKVVDEALAGLVIMNPNLRLLAKHRVIYRADIRNIRDEQVTLVSGGGSGHEPSHAGFVGDGMLSAAVSGDVFASPSASQVLAAIKLVGGRKGVLIILKNYTGDRLQFGKAAERAKRELGIKVEVVVVGEDCAIARERAGIAGRRGLAGVLFVHKVAGHLARSGAPLDVVRQHAQYVADNIGTVGVALTSCSIPGAGPAFTLGPEEMELGLGIHGDKGSQAIVLLNNLGGTTMLEMNILTKETVEFLVSKDIKPVRIMTGTMLTSLEMAGLSFTLLRLPDGKSSGPTSEALLEAFDSKVQPHSWPPVVPFMSEIRNEEELLDDNIQEEQKNFPTETQPGKQLGHSLAIVAKALMDAEPQLTAYDTIVGDGDCGNSFAKGAQAIQSQLVDDTMAQAKLPLDTPSEALSRLSAAIEMEMGGSAGAMCCLFLDAAAHALPADSPDVKSWAAAVTAGVAAIQRYGGASVGDRTMVDALVPLMEELNTSAATNAADAITKAAIASRTGADGTAEMDKAKAGRTSYIGKGVRGTPDPGAIAVAVIAEAVSKSLEGKV